MDDIRRVTPQEALRLYAGGALIVATYPEDRFRSYAYVAEAVSLDTFSAMLPELDRKRGLVFY